MSSYIVKGERKHFRSAALSPEMKVGRVFNGAFPSLRLVGVEARIVASNRKQSSLFGSFGPYKVTYTLEIRGRQYELSEDDVEVEV